MWIGESARLVGELVFNEQGNRRTWSTFSYADIWLEQTGRFAISFDLPLLRTHFNKKADNGRDGVFHYALQDTEPDGLVRRVILRDFTRQRKDGRMQKKALSRLDYLCGKATSLGGMRPKSGIMDEAGQPCIGKFSSVNDERAVTEAAPYFSLTRDARY